MTYRVSDPRAVSPRGDWTPQKQRPGTMLLLILRDTGPQL